MCIFHIFNFNTIKVLYVARKNVLFLTWLTAIAFWFVRISTAHEILDEDKSNPAIKGAEKMHHREKWDWLSRSVRFVLGNPTKQTINQSIINIGGRWKGKISQFRVEISPFLLNMYPWTPTSNMSGSLWAKVEEYGYKFTLNHRRKNRWSKYIAAKWKIRSRVTGRLPYHLWFPASCSTKEIYLRQYATYLKLVEPKSMVDEHPNYIWKIIWVCWYCSKLDKKKKGLMSFFFFFFFFSRNSCISIPTFAHFSVVFRRIFMFSGSKMTEI